MGKRREDNWGRWGSEDERGSLNLLTGETTVAAARLVQQGRCISLALPIDQRSPRVPASRAPALHLMSVDGGDYAAGAVPRDGVHGADGYVLLPVHSGTHIDALAHVWYGEHIYNGFPSTTVRSSGAARCGVDKIRGIATRGVLLDVAAYHGGRLEPGQVITADDLDGAARCQGVEVGTGDAVLVRTGWLEEFLADPDAHSHLQAGIGEDTVPWLVEHGVIAVAADNYAVEAMPSSLPVHKRLLRDYGVYLVENVVLHELANEGVNEFLFVAAPLVIKRGVGSPINPLAIF